MNEDTVDEIDDAAKKPSGEPHEKGFLFDLMKVFNRVSHPFAWDRFAEDGGLNPNQPQDVQNINRLARDRKERYRIFEEMDSGYIAGFLDLLSEECTQPDHDKELAVWIEASNPEIKKNLENCLRNIMAEDQIHAVTRRTLKFGDDFKRLIYQSGQGVLGWKHVPVQSVERVNDRLGRLVGFAEDGVKFRGKERGVSWPWDYVHFRLLGKDEETTYGTSYLDALFNPWRQLTMSEDSVLQYMVRRAPDRNMILVDVGEMEESEAMSYLNIWRKRFRKQEFIDPASPDYKKRWNPLTPMEDIFIPVRGENTSRIEDMGGKAGGSDILPLEYFRNKFFGVAKIPKAYMGFEGEINAKATLMQQDVRFARTCKRIVKANIYGLRQVADVHLTLLRDSLTKTDPENLKFDIYHESNAYLIKMSPVSFLDEYERLELFQLRYQLIEAMAGLAQSLQMDMRVWASYILLQFAKLPEALVLKLLAKGNPATPPVPNDGAPQENLDSVGKRIHQKLMKQLNEDKSDGTQGFYCMTESERKMVDQAVHKSPALRKIIGDIAWFHEGDDADWVSARALRQTDASLLPAHFSESHVIKDDVTLSSAEKELNEDLKILEETNRSAINEALRKRK